MIDVPPTTTPRRNKPRTRVARSWAFTINNPTQAEQDAIVSLAENDRVLDIVVGQELADSGTPHLQGFIRMASPTTMLRIKQLIGSRAHLEPARSDASAAEYCRKEGRMLVDKCTRRQSGHRSDLDALVLALNQGGLQQARADCPQLLIKYPSGCRLYCSLGAPSPMRPNLHVELFYGPTGIGKSYAAHLYPDTWTCTLCVTGQQWFDGYNGQRTLILDEYNGQLPFRQLLRILDVYPCDLQIKGGTTGAHWTHVIITSNWNWTDWYPKESDLSPLGRRIHITHTRFPFGFVGPIPDAGAARLYLT